MQKRDEAVTCPEQTGTVLIVDDDGEVRHLLTSMLKDTGHTLIEAESGEEALNLCDEHAASLVDGAIDHLGAVTEQRSLVIDTPPAPVPVYCDRDTTIRILANLLSNAVRHTPAGREIHVAFEAKAREVCFRVSDSGPGIPAEYHEKIFEKFGQVEGRNAGVTRTTGLGLTFCRLAVEAHGGRIGVDSSPGEGSTFWFSLPKRQDDADPS